MKQIANLYSFDASARSLSITGLSISQARLLLVVNASRNEVLYNFAGGPGVTSYALEGGNTVLHLLADTTSHADTDALTIFYEDGLSREESLTITDLQTIQGSLPAAWLTGAEVPVAGPLTDTQLRAQAIVSRAVSDSFSTLSGNVGTAAATVLAGAPRTYLLIQNLSPAPLHANFGADASTATLRLDAGAALIFEGNFIPSNYVSLIGTTANQSYCILYRNI